VLVAGTYVSLLPSGCAAARRHVRRATSHGPEKGASATEAKALGGYYAYQADPDPASLFVFGQGLGCRIACAPLRGRGRSPADPTASPTRQPTSTTGADTWPPAYPPGCAAWSRP
jgi:hypothetical protein